MTALRATALIALMSLSACGGSDESTSFNAINAKFTDIDTRATQEDPLTTEVMPTGGRVTYSGAAVYSEGPTTYMVSNMEFAANFTTGRASSTLSNFVLSDNTRLGGKVTMNSAAITGSAYSGALAGSLSYDGNSAPVTGTMTGDFYRPDASLVSGYINMQVSGATSAITGFGAVEKN